MPNVGLCLRDPSHRRDVIKAAGPPKHPHTFETNLLGHVFFSFFFVLCLNKTHEQVCSLNVGCLSPC